MIEGNLLIRASAGTGKTFSLATRFIRLMLFDGVSPDAIVALTFSRAAAQEIYTKILERLCRAAESEEGAQAERDNLLAGFDAGALREIGAKNVDWSAGNFARLLRRVVSAQHVGAIATLDSFILRIVRNFPLEMGFQNAVEVLDEPGEKVAVDKALQALLFRAAGSDGFVRTFLDALDGRVPRVLSNALDQMMEREGWRKFVLAHPESARWTAESMAREMGVCDHPDFSKRSDLKVSAFLDFASKEPADVALAKFANHLLSVGHGESPLPASKTSIAGEVVQALLRHPTDSYVEHTKKNENGPVEILRYDYPPKTFEAARCDLTRLVENYLFHQLRIVEAKLRLLAYIEREYDSSTRRAGLLTFQDFTDYSAAAENSDRGLAIQNLEFRFDTLFDHWALDEFQDTSEVQWRCLKRLVESAATAGDGRTVIALGDLKQSIYAWRGGDEAPFKEMMAWAAFHAPAGRIADSNTSHRYRQNTCAFVNAVFGADNISKSGLFPAERKEAVRRWLSEDCWQEHEAERDAEGRFRTDDFVQVIGVKPTEEEIRTQKDHGFRRLLPALGETLKRVWNEHERGDSEETVGVLVRQNGDGLTLAEYLRGEGLPVVWEGMNVIADVPAVKAVVRLLHFAEHPEDTFDWTFVNRLLPVREILFPDTDDPTEVSRRLAESLSRHGLARTLKDLCGKLALESNGLDDLSKMRLHALVRAGVGYERRKDVERGMDGFADFLASSGRREIASSSKAIRILTIHRSKGLTLDRVFVPISESARSQIIETKASEIIFGKGRQWVLPHLPLDLATVNPSVRAVVEEQRDERLLEALRTHYVALTRSRKALYVVLPTDEGEGEVHFRDVVLKATGRTPLRSEPAGEILYERGEEPPFAPPAEKKSEIAPAPWTHAPGRPPVERLSPSATAHRALGKENAPASSLFDEDFGEAAREGDREHDRYAAIEWAEGETLAEMPEGFRKCFVRPDATATVWRERAYEVFFNGKWETGRFDRVVFSGSGEERRAVVYDFKTNHPRPDEDAERFAQRLRETYAGQMRLYRQAVCRLTGLRSERVTGELLLVATGDSVPC